MARRRNFDPERQLQRRILAGGGLAPQDVVKLARDGKAALFCLGTTECKG